MKQNVNFYRGGAKGPTLLFGIEWMIGTIITTSVLLAIISTVQVLHNKHLKASVIAAEKELQDTNARLLQTVAEHPIVTKTDPLLVEEAEHKQHTIAEIRNMLDTIKGGDWANHGGFAAYFEAFARQTVAGVWLTGIALEEGGKNIVLEGKTLDAGNIPVLVQALGKETIFNGKTFSDLTIKQSEEQIGRVDFILRTVPKKEEDGEH